MNLASGSSRRARSDDLRTLSLVDIFEPLSPEELGRINWRHLSTRVERGEIFYTPMDLGETLFVLRQGRIRLYRKSPEGKEFTLAVIQSGTLFGEMALTGQRLRNSYAEGMEPSEVAALCRADLERLILEKPRVGLQMVHLLSGRLATYEERMEGLGLREVPARLAGTLLHLVHEEGVRGPEGYRISTRYTHRELASMIGSNREAVTRAIATLRERRVIETRRRYIHVRDLGRLEEATEDGFYHR